MDYVYFSSGKLSPMNTELTPQEHTTETLIFS